MRCPFCGHPDDKVIDSRAAPTGDAVRRRRECEACAKRFTTYERVEYVLPAVVKKDGRREAFDRGKLVRSLRVACVKRPVGEEPIESMVDRLEQEIHEGGQRELTTTDLGERVMRLLRGLDVVAYVRFASVYRSFQNVEEFAEELRRLGTAGEGESAPAAQLTAAPPAPTRDALGAGRGEG
jgi:transcriptional repressor NrdR